MENFFPVIQSSACFAIHFPALHGSGSSRCYLAFLFITFIFYSLVLQAGNKQSIVVGVDTVSVKNYGEKVNAIGSLVAREQVIVTSQVAGFIDLINFKDGAQVEIEQRLIKLDCRLAQAKLNKVTAKLNEDIRRLKELHNLVTKKAASRSELESQQSRVSQSRAAFQAAETTLNYYSIQAPFSGVLGMSQLSKGQYIRPGDPLVTLVNLDKLYVDFNLPSRYLSQVKAGQYVSLSFEVWPGKVFKAQISGVDPIINENSRNLKIRGNIDNNGYLLFPGLLADIIFRLPSTNRLLVNTSSIFYKGSQAYVYRVNNDNTIALSAVSTGASYGNETCILNGLKAGERVVSRAIVKLSDGMEIIPEPQSLPVTVDKSVSESKS